MSMAFAHISNFEGCQATAVEATAQNRPPSLFDLPISRSVECPAFYPSIYKVNMTQLPPCPQCQSEFTYEDGAMWNCPECGHEWAQTSADAGEQQRVIKDAHGNILQDGDSVTVIKDLKIKGSSAVVKVGTKVKNIRLVDGDHDIDCKIDGIGAMGLKSEFVKKA